mgnify:FL=1
MSCDRNDLLTVRAEAIGAASAPWAWAIYRGPKSLLILRSRPVYRDRADALGEGVQAATEIGRRLRAPIIVEEAQQLGEAS